jgi:hypothetical protein
VVEHKVSLSLLHVDASYFLLKKNSVYDVYYAPLPRVIAPCYGSNGTDTTTDKCENAFGDFESFNSTGNLTIPGFTLPHIVSSNWTVNIGVKDKCNATDSSSATEVFTWIDSTNRDTDLNSVDLPYTGCLVSLVLTRKRQSSGSIGEGDGCEGVFSDKRYNALVENAKTRAFGLSGTDHIQKKCLDAVEWVKDACDDEDACGAKTANSESNHGLAKPTFISMSLLGPN